MRTAPDERTVAGGGRAPDPRDAFGAGVFDDLPPEPAAPTFAGTLFGGSRFVSLCLVPVLVVAGAGFLFTVPDWRSWHAGVFVTLSLACFLFALALACPRRCAWAARIVTGMVFLACCAYVVAADFPDERGQPELADALRAMLLFGLPALWFTVRRRRRAAA